MGGSIALNDNACGRIDRCVNFPAARRWRSAPAALRLPSPAGRRAPCAAAKEAAEEIAKFTGGKTAENGKIAIELPEIAENGNTVPLSVTVDAPMTADNYVSDILVVADGNPQPGRRAFPFHAAVGQGRGCDAHPARHHAEHHRGRQDQRRASSITDQKLVKVTIGGCGG